MNNTIVNLKKNECTGCSACYNICPKNAISMNEDEYGNIYPKIDNDKCIKCGLCNKICPQINKKITFNKPIKAYAMHMKDLKKRTESTSGGAATLFYEEILKQNGVVYGASNLFGENEFKFIRIDDINDLYKIKGSKYVHCYINNTYMKVKDDLLSSKKVLFIGTPCQVAGLKSFLMKDYDNLITVDIICHGVPSQKLLFDEISHNHIRKSDVYYVFFRDSKMHTFKLLDRDKNIILEKPGYFVEYHRNFLHGNIYRENCYSCKYAKKERISDITIGDFWGLAKESIVYDNELYGISLLMPSTKKGLELIKLISKKCVIEERNLDEAYKGNGQLNHPTKISKKFIIYKKEYPKVGYERTMKKMLNVKDQIKLCIKKIIKR